MTDSVINTKTYHNRLPKHATYNIADYASSNNYIQSRQMKRFVPVTGNVYGDGVISQDPNVCRINISGPFLMDGLNSYLTFKLKITKSTKNETLRLFDSGHSVISEVLILDKEGNTLELVRDYNRIHSMLSCVTVSDAYRKSLAGRAEGYGDDETMKHDFGPATTAADNIGGSIVHERSFCLNLLSGILKSEKMLPMIVMRGIQIVLTFDRAVNACICANAPTAYSIYDVAYMCEAMSMSELYTSRLLQASQNGIRLPFHSFGYTSVNQDGTTMHSVVSRNYSQVKTVFAVHVLNTDRNVITKRPDIFYSAKLVSYQWENGTMLFPAQPVDVAKETTTSIAQLQSALRYLGDVSNTCPIDEMFYYDKGLPAKGAGNKLYANADYANAAAITDAERAIVATYADPNNFQVVKSIGRYSITAPTNRYANAGSKFIIGQEFERDSWFSSTVNTDDSPLVLTTVYEEVTSGLSINMYVHYDALMTIYPTKITVDK